MARWGLFLIGVTVLAASAGRLSVGDPLPPVSGETLSGKRLDLPTADSGSTRVLVFSFAKAASADSKLWNQRMDKDLGPLQPHPPLPADLSGIRAEAFS